MTISIGAKVAEGSFTVGSLRCEGLESPRLIESVSPRFSWQMQSDERGLSQGAYQFRMKRSLAEDWNAADESERIESDQSQWVLVDGLSLSSKTRYDWQVRVWDERGRGGDWSETAHFETGLFGGEWLAEWISDGKRIEKEQAPPARYFRDCFTVGEKPVQATLYMSALGLAEPWINGEKVGEDSFAPGWPDYRKRAFYVSYDVTGQIDIGENVLGLVLGDGWYSSTLFLGHQYGETPLVSAWVELLNADGSTSVVRTDGSWHWANGPIVENGIYFGESHDARLENPDWATVADKDWKWNPAVVVERPKIALDARISPPVRRIEELGIREVRKTDRGTYIYDLGQNMVGWVRLKVQEDAGSEVILTFAEMLEEDGSMHLANLRSAHATARYVSAGAGVEVWEPSFTFFGFRYVELIGVEKPLADAITGVVVHSDLPRAGHFECSNPLLNQLYSNTLWGQKGNFLELPTDCPQRDERLGWTGDAQVFCHTALYNMDGGSFYRQWLAAVRDSFEDGPDGGFGGVAPFTGFSRGAAGWSDAGAIVPWITWLHTGDKTLLEENFESTERWVQLMKESAPDGIRISQEGWGDWLAPWHEPKEAPTPYQLIATAYYAYSTQIAVWMAEVLDRPEKTSEYKALLAEVKAAFAREYIGEDGKIQSDEQTAYLLALAFDLVPGELRKAMVGHLVKAFEAKGNHLATGFIGTPLLAPVLTDVGRTDLAYEVVLQETYPGWLFSVKNGATTIWERWDSWTPEVGFNPGGMNSFNHYAYGAVVGWFYDTVAGIKIDPKFPGWKHFGIAPHVGGGLSHASARVETPFGLVVSSWRVVDGRFELEVRIPANASALVSLPFGSMETILESGEPLAGLAQATEIKVAAGRVQFELESGEYSFVGELK